MSHDIISRTQTKKVILQIANKLFVQNGYHGVTFQAIASQLGLTKSSIFFHYKSKEILACKTLQVSTSLVRDKIEPLLKTNISHINLVQIIYLVLQDHLELIAPIQLAAAGSEVVTHSVKHYFNNWIRLLCNIKDGSWAIYALSNVLGILFLYNLYKDDQTFQHLIMGMLESGIF